MQTLSPKLRHFVVPLLLVLAFVSPGSSDHVRNLQSTAWQNGTAPWGHWGTNPEKYSTWKSHSNRLIPIYTFGIGLETVNGNAGVYRDADRLRQLYGRLPRNTHNPAASWFDQTDVFRLQMEAAKAGKKHIVLIVFDGMDWQTTWAAAIYKQQQVAYREGRGSGLHLQDYRGVETGFGYFVTSPHNDGTQVDVDAQTVVTPGGRTAGGYDYRRGGATPWALPAEPNYLLGKSRDTPHAVTDSASSATSITAGIKTYNNGVNVGPDGQQVATIAQRLQHDRGFSVGVVTSVPISHATPACAYSHNVTRHDYQDLTRDLLGLPSITHRPEPLSGVDVLLGCGWGQSSTNDASQGANFVPGNKYLTNDDLLAIDARNGGNYVVALRTPGIDGGQLLDRAAVAARDGQRLFGFYGVKGGHLPYETADGDFDPTVGVKPAERYSQADIDENPTLAEMTRAALTVLETNPQGFWLMVEAGDVDWANHDNNIDNSIGAVLSGDAAFREITKWAEANDCWDDTAVIVTADHGHFFVLTQPDALIPSTR